MESTQIDYEVKFVDYGKTVVEEINKRFNISSVDFKKLDLRFLRFVDDVLNTSVMNISISTDLITCFEFLEYAMNQANIWVNYDLAVYRKYGRLIQVLLKRTARLAGASRFDLHVFREDSIFGFDKSLVY